MLVDVGDTRLHIEERGDGDVALIALHGGPGLDHTTFGDGLDPLTGDGIRLLLVDERARGRSEPASAETWTLAHHARDVDALGLERCAARSGLRRPPHRGRSSRRACRPSASSRAEPPVADGLDVIGRALGRAPWHLPGSG